MQNLASLSISDSSLDAKAMYEHGKQLLDVSENVLDMMLVHYIGGLFETVGTIKHDHCSIKLDRTDLLSYIANKMNIPFTLSDNRLSYHGSHALDFIEKIYPNGVPYGVSRATCSYENNNNYLLGKYVPCCYVKKTHHDAVIPFKSHLSDVGYDLTLIEIAKKINSVCTLYNTGISIQLDHGFYAEIVPRSSIIKSGYMLANSIGIIDNAYNGNLMVALIKIDPNAEDITLPNRLFQLIIRKQYHAQMIEVESLTETSRGSGGFGSTN